MYVKRAVTRYLSFSEDPITNVHVFPKYFTLVHIITPEIHLVFCSYRLGPGICGSEQSESEGVYDFYTTPCSIVEDY